MEDVAALGSRVSRSCEILAMTKEKRRGPGKVQQSRNYGREARGVITKSQKRMLNNCHPAIG